MNKLRKNGIGFKEIFKKRSSAPLANPPGVLKEIVAEILDTEYYLSCYPDLHQWDAPLLDHYVMHGWREGRDVNAFFDAQWYKAMNPDVDFSLSDPVTHFLMSGEAENRWPHPLFDPTWYREHYSEGVLGGLSPFIHFLRVSLVDGREVSPFFATTWYRHAYREDLISSDHPILHFLEHGATGKFDPNPDFSSKFYLDFNEDIRSSGINPYIHYLKHGRREGRAVKPVVIGGGLELKTKSRDLENIYDNLSYLPPFTDNTIELENLDGIKLCSFDVWNTLLHRDCHPDEIKFQSARYLSLIAHKDLKPAYANARNLYSARLYSENNSCPMGDFEYRFRDAMEMWLVQVLKENISQERRWEYIHALERHEFKSESRATRADPTTKSAIEKLNLPYIFASDFYLDSKFIRRLLDSHGVGGQWVGGYSSSETYESKRSGKQFRKILADYQLAPEELCHVGDNPHADQSIPNSMGIRTLPFVPESEIERMQWYQKAFSEHLQGELGSHHDRLLGVLDQFSKLNDGQERFGDAELFKIGIRLAPIVYSFCLSVLQSVVKKGEEVVFFFTREGHFFKQVYDSICQENPFNLETLPKSCLLSVSRRATFAASLTVLDPDQLMRLWTLYSTQSLQGFCKSLNFDERHIKRIGAQYALEFDANVEHPWKNPAFLAFLADPEFQRYARGSISNQRELLLKYLEQSQYPTISRGSATIVDIGWRGTIQDNLAWLTGGRTAGHYLGLFSYLNIQHPRSTKVGWFADANGLAERRIPNEVAPLEMIFNGLGGSVVGYYQATDNVEPLTEIIEEEEELIRSLAPLQEGMLAAVPIISAYMRLHGLLAEDIRDMGSDIIASIIEKPPTPIADLFAKLAHNETFGIGKIDLVGGQSFASISAEMRPDEVHHSIERWLASARWREGAVRRTAAKRWWQEANTAQRAAAPLELSVLASPAIGRIFGENLSVYIPPVLRASGGHRTIFNMVKRLADAGMKPHLFMENEGAGIEVVEEYLGGTGAQLYNGWRSHVSSTVAFATIAHSAKFVRENVSATRSFYFVQDAEAFFNPVGDTYVDAENSYAQGLEHITIGNWLSHVITKQYRAKASASGLGVDTLMYNNLGGKRRNAVCMLYQPEKPRRGTELAFNALRLLKERNPDIEIYLYGSDLQPAVDFPVHNLGIIHDIRELNALYNMCKAGLCISLTNPSRIPYEMMAAGCMPVDLYRYNNLMDHDEGTIILAYQSAFSIACGLEIAIEKNASNEFSSQISSRSSSRTLLWENDNIVGHVLSSFCKRNQASSPPIIKRYNAKPVIADLDNNDAVSAYCDWQGRLAQS